MWNLLARFGQYFVTFVMPVRFRRSHLEARATQYIDRTVDSWEHPDQLADMAAKDVERELAKKTKEAAADQAKEEAKAETGHVDVQAQQPGPKPRRFWPVVRWVVHFLLVALVLYGLWWLNWLLGIPRLLRSEWTFLYPYWLPILFLIIYVLLWLGGWLWQLTGPDNVGTEYPDITQAWNIAVDALFRAGIDIRQTPVFLVLGRTEAPANHLFGTTLKLRVTSPLGNVTPLRVYASQDRVFITCPGASLLARQARTLTQQTAENHATGNGEPLNPQTTTAPPVASAVSTRNGDQPGQAGATPGNGSNSAVVAPAAAPQATTVETIEPTTEPWTEEDRRVLGLLMTEGRGTGPKAKKLASTFLKDPVEVRQLTSRLHHLCKLILRDRKPYCPINGILVLVPHAATADDTDASHTATACRYDLMVIRKTFQVQCPILALICDMENSEGFRQFLYRLPSPQSVSRLGQPFPLYPDVDEREIPRLVETGTAWLTNALLPSLVYNLFRLETPPTPRSGGLSPQEALSGNIRLYRFLTEMREQRRRLSRLLTRGLMLDVPRAFFFGGIYLASTGQQMTAFVNGVFLRLLQTQNFVTWTPEALASERRYLSLSWIMIFVNGALLIGGPILAYLFWPR